LQKTYLVGKIGKSVKFNSKDWGAIGGDNEAPILINKIAELNPDDTFIIIGRNDVDKNRRKLNIPLNIINAYEGANKDEKCDINYLKNKLINIQIDGCFLLSGPTGCVNIPQKSFKRIPLKNGIKEYSKPLSCFQNYVAHIYTFLNESHIPWVMIANDPRYIRQGNDLMNQPSLILSQYDENISMKSFDNWEDQNYIKNNIQSKYAQIEKIGLIDREIQYNINKSTSFMVVLNEGNNGVKSRYSMLKEYVLDYIKDVKIYGKWDKKTIGDDTRFKGPKKYIELQDELKDVKYTLIIPIKKGWVTAKWVEMIASGIIPFFHPTYDEQNHCNVPDYIRLEKPLDLYKKINELDSNPKLYKLILSKCLACITKDDLNGTLITKTIINEMPSINKKGNKFSENIIDEKIYDW